MLAADSRVTLNSAESLPNNQILILPSTFDNATKLLSVKSQPFIGAVTYGAGAIGQKEPRTAHSFLPEFETERSAQEQTARLPVKEFAQRLSDFFMRQWTTSKMPLPAEPGSDMVFLVAGYDEAEAYGRIFEIYVPSKPDPKDLVHSGEFGAVWGGQREITDRLLRGSHADPHAAVFQ